MVGATRYITVGRHPRLGLQQSNKRGGIPNNPHPILVVGRTKSLWGISSLLTSDVTLYLFEYHALLLDVIIVIVYWTGKKGRGVCVCLLGIQSSRRIMPGDEEELKAGDVEPETFEDLWLS